MDSNYTVISFSGSISPTVPQVFAHSEGLTVEQHINRFNRLEEELLKLPQLGDDGFKLKEYSNGNMYVREITIPKGACLTGRTYKRDHIEIMVSGDIIILSATGERKHYTGYNTLEASKGKRQAGFALEETVWLSINIVPEDVENKLDHTAVIANSDYLELLCELNRKGIEEDLCPQ